MAVDLAALVRGASGALFVVAGIVALVLGHLRGADRRTAWGVAVFAAGFGGGFALRNLLSTFPSAAVALVLGALAAWIAALGGLLLVIPRVLPRSGSLVALLVAVAIYVPSATANWATRAAFALTAPQAPVDLYTVSVLGQEAVGAAAMGVGLAIALRPPYGPARLLLSLSLLLYPAVAAPSLLEESLVATIARGTAVLVAAAAWLAASERGGGRGAIAACWLVLGAALAGLVQGLADATARGGYTVGVVRTVAATCLMLALLRHDLLGSNLTDRTVRRASGAAVGLAVLLVVAQVAQNYFSARFGLLMGGVVAGAFLFAAQPLQRAFEGRAEGRAPFAAGPAASRLDAYREAVRFALADRALTRREETHLARLAQELGIGAADALRVRHEVEDERGAPK